MKIGGAAGTNVTSMLVHTAVVKNQELKEVIDQPTKKQVEPQREEQKADTPVETSSQDSSSAPRADHLAGRVVNVEA